MIVENRGFERTLGILEKTLSANVQRREIIANNLANAETPNFKRSELSFEADLKRAFAYEASKQQHLQAKTTHEKHIAFATPPLWNDVQPTRRLDYLSTMQANGNNVDLEQEVVERAKADRMYELLTTVTKFQFNQISIVAR
ncbi:flagellar basal body rod protein FlgB [Entomospira culicis]|uniref:Flagellar basal body rod protein FlgB n=1 Tax=Entomospira culicis TaxID=2719989 RepID=A0A968GJA9_9SPIO|nr:flagellar basal body rod protein FlgB [Entomospira culicis]NIZ19375.1 flagellar basal body rod protein FlgB [Entomospira culicis]NIZ69720.1 flagellar basal body rod protein FlgB [Entomospira culicis]WDI36831.1 flagellar basal body rod protein FlgB [Entomospira culicis]WDI38460.1 flagellar basal body rod protein FlgB [Entomospira culicis]